MYHSSFGLKQDPFGAAPDSRFIVLSPTHREALATLVYAMDQREGWALLQGEAGLGKTTLLKALLLRLGPEVVAVVVSRPAPALLPFYNQLGLALNLEGPFEHKGRFLSQFRALLERLRARQGSLLLIIDDAQLLPPELLIEIHLLGNEDPAVPRVLNLFLSARLLFHHHLDQAQERDLRQLLHRQGKVSPLDQEQSAAYVSQRLRLAGGDPGLFPEDYLVLIHQAAQGVPRYLNALCAYCLTQAGERGPAGLTPELVRAAMEQMPRLAAQARKEGSPDRPQPPPPARLTPSDKLFPSLGESWDPCAHPEPRPEIDPEEQKLENRLMNRCANLYRGLSWWDKTTAFTVEWDNLRRKRLGLLGPSFPSFCPRWVDDRWGAFNRARQEADYEGAIYSEWIAAQYQRVLGDSLGEMPLAELAGPAARKQYLSSRGEPGGGEVTAPYDWEGFDPQVPEHARHAGGALDEIFDLANYVCAQEGKRAEDLVTEAVCQAVLPLKALQGLPKLKQEVAQSLDRRGAPSPQPSPAPQADHPPILV